MFFLSSELRSAALSAFRSHHIWTWLLCITYNQAHVCLHLIDIQRSEFSVGYSTLVLSLSPPTMQCIRVLADVARRHHMNLEGNLPRLHSMVFEKGSAISIVACPSSASCIVRFSIFSYCWGLLFSFTGYYEAVQLCVLVCGFTAPENWSCSRKIVPNSD
jgi:hypothetical protein